MRHRLPIYLAIGLPLSILLVFVLYNLPPIHDRLEWRISNARSQIQYALHPPEEAVFVPQEQVDVAVQQTLAAMKPTSTVTPTHTPAVPATSGATSTPQPTATPTLTPSPLPPSVRLTGIIHEYQKWNNCGPTTLAMALTYWKWQGDQRDTAAFMKPNPRDKNVMPYEMQSFISEKTGLKSVLRVGGDIYLLKRFLAAGFPVIIEKGFEVAKEGWMGHYEVVTGYDDAKQVFITQDSYIMADLPVSYNEMEAFWLHFNNLYLVIYQPEQEAQVMALLGDQADEIANYQYAATLASNEISALQGRDLYFAWYNRGTNLVKLQDYTGAAQAYDQAFAQYAALDENIRPWRMLWYQTGPYFAYYYTGRYNDVISLANTTINAAGEPAIEESFYWRALAEAALGDNAHAIEDLRQAIEWHPGFQPAFDELHALGESY